MIDLMNEELMEHQANKNCYSLELMKAVEAVRQWNRWFSGLDVMSKDVTDGEILMVIHHKSQMTMLMPNIPWHPEQRKSQEERTRKMIDEQNARVLKNNAEWARQGETAIHNFEK